MSKSPREIVLVHSGLGGGVGRNSALHLAAHFAEAMRVARHIPIVDIADLVPPRFGPSLGDVVLESKGLRRGPRPYSYESQASAYLRKQKAEEKRARKNAKRLQGSSNFSDNGETK